MAVQTMALRAPSHSAAGCGQDGAEGGERQRNHPGFPAGHPEQLKG
jgi:hypothetical protein